ncbi:MAG: hypothetical protein WEB57_11960 [Pseudohongiellaceae bacterium]
MSKAASEKHTTTDSLSERAHESVDQIARTAGKGGKRIRDEAAGAEARARQVGRNARDRSDEALHSISVFVQDNPVTSLGVAFTAGALLSALKRRS